MLQQLTGRKKKIHGGAVVAQMLRAEGVEKAFGIIDGTYFGLYSNFGDVGIDFISPRHESCAAHMAGAYARASGKLGVCLASNGPGVANILPGVAVENAEGNRVLSITSARRTGSIAPDRGGTFQSFPQIEVTAAMTKWSGRVPSFERLPELLRRALRMCFKGRPGVVHLDIPENIMNGKFDPPGLWRPNQYRSVEALSPSPDQIDAAVRLLTEAERPIIHVGSGVIHAGAFKELDRVARRLAVPVTTSWGGRSAVCENKGYAVPLYNIALNNKVRNEADLVLTLGSRLGETDWWGKAPYWAKPSEQKMIQVDIDEEALGVNKPADLAIVSCVKVFLRELEKALEKSGMDTAKRRAWLARVQDDCSKGRTKLDRKLDRSKSPMGSPDVVHACRAFFEDDAIVVFDGGNTAVWGNFFHEVRTPNTVLGTFKMGMLGAGTPQALGAKVAFPERQVYCLTGDGAMGMHIQELETAVRNGLKVIYLVFCDKQWGMVKMNQQFTLKPLKTIVKKSLGPDETINTDFAEIEFDALARSLGAYGERVGSVEELEAALARCRDHQGPSVIHVDVDPVGHMWAPGLKAFKDMHAEPKG